MSLLDAVSKPYYLHRPRQIALRIARALWTRGGPERQVTLPWGPRISISTDEMLGISIWQTGVFDIAVSEVIWRLLGPGDHAVDVGANIGYMTSLMACRVGETGSIVAFEPHPKVRRALMGNLALFEQVCGRVPITVRPEALSNRSAQATLVMGEHFAANQGLARLAEEGEEAEGLPVSTCRLDEVLSGTRIALLKLDVEGHEALVLEGSEGLLRAGSIRTILYEDLNGSQSEVHAQLRDYGYTVFSLGWRTSGLVIAGADASVAQAYEAPSYLATLDGDRVTRALSEPGWRVLERRPAR